MTDLPKVEAIKPQSRADLDVNDNIQNTSQKLDEMVKLMKEQMRGATEPLAKPAAKGKEKVTAGQAIAKEAVEETTGLFRSLIPSISDIVDSATTNSPGLRLVSNLVGGVTDFTKKALSRVEEGSDAVEEAPEPATDDGQLELLAVNRLQLDILGQLLRVWEGDLAEMNKAAEEQLAQAQAQTEIMRDQQQDAERAAVDGLEREGQADAGFDIAVSTQEAEDKMSGLDAMMFAFTGGISSIIAAMSPIVAKLKPLKRLLRVGPLALVATVYDFVDGFINAEEILGRGNIQIEDRVQAGVATIAEGFGKLFDTVAGWVGFDTDTASFLREGAIDITQGLVDQIGVFREFVSESFKEGWQERLGTRLENVKDELTDSIASAVDASSSALSNFFTNIWDGVLNRLISLVDTVNIGGVADGLIERLESGLSTNRDVATDTTKVDTTKAAVQSVDYREMEMKARAAMTARNTGGDVGISSNINTRNQVNNNYSSNSVTVHRESTYSHNMRQNLVGNR
ncbi:hypothetical protein GR28A_00048 [Vibrio phage vB_VcorM_GR28A]|nr:hypothetical protein GR28A_00048 [Vibrio phage vB_VcorM_GR28A]